MVRVGSTSDIIDLWQKAAGMCRRSKQGFYVQTSVNAILTNQRNHNS